MNCNVLLARSVHVREFEPAFYFGVESIKHGRELLDGLVDLALPSEN